MPVADPQPLIDQNTDKQTMAMFKPYPEDYRFHDEEKIGEGSYGIVYKSYDKLRQKVSDTLENHSKFSFYCLVCRYKSLTTKQI